MDEEGKFSCPGGHGACRKYCKKPPSLGIGAGQGGNFHIIFFGGSVTKYKNFDGTTTTIYCGRLGLGVFFGTSTQLSLSINNNNYKPNFQNGCYNTWSIGGSADLSVIKGVGMSAAAGPSGGGVAFDIPISPATEGAGLYGGVEVCVIRVCR